MRLLQHAKQIDPSLAGWISLTSELQNKTSSTKEHMLLINAPIEVRKHFDEFVAAVIKIHKPSALEDINQALNENQRREHLEDVNLIRNPSQPTFLTGRVLSFSCEPGFTLEGPESIYCRSYHNWNDNAIPRCTRGCPYPGNFKNGYYLDKMNAFYTSSGKAVTEQITSHCYQTFKLQGSQIRVCLSNGNWSDSDPKCVPTLCLPPHVIPPNDRYVFSDGSDSSSKLNLIGVKLFLKCIKGYSSKENDYITCTEEGQWHHNKRSGCQIVNCTNPGEVENGFYTLRNNYDNHPYTGLKVSFGTAIYVSCLEGFAISENSQLVCNENGSWSGSKPACTNITCDIPPKFGNGKYHSKNNDILEYGKVGYKEQILVHCNEGYTLQTHPQRTCIKSNNWTGETPICEEIFCSKPFPASNGTYMDNTGKILTQDKIKYNKTITFHCLIGYNLTSGTAIRRCQDNGTWSGTKPKCSPITCTKPKETPCGYYSSNITTSEDPVGEFLYNTTLLFVCNYSKYSCPNKTKEIRCSEDGVWSDNKHLCGVLKDIKQEQTGKNDTEYTNSDALIGAICGVVFIIGSGVFVTFIVLKRRNIFRRKKSDDERQSFRSSLTHATDLEIIH
ncbi:sushi, von Willebrand factor type A, EGF and pentraxin domain-containing protein 1-like [Ruditapes philippinarum]|uniref:sushi, von Willebrand factor type A, EGF and pentraxin domain-containing protein 1-like n=1 Tax=Ruditapes philippinarum TaxID=129788 RepID=UPI00295B8AFF|nr:sushi, von Willebrand factor type A, EGF and pentraxin domain-containing protein 1-like [Ruditapes philippinarum]